LASADDRRLAGKKENQAVLTTEHSISNHSTRTIEEFINLLLYMASSRVADVRIIRARGTNSQFNADFLLHDR